MNIVVANHQPNFFPWLGYFNKIANSDKFVFLDTVTFPKTGGGNVMNRTKIVLNGEARWLTCPLKKVKSNTPVNEVEIVIEEKKKILNLVMQAYAKAPFYKEIMPSLKEMILNEHIFLYKYNIENIRKLCEMLGIKTEMILQSEVGSESKKTELMIELVKKAGGDVYLSGTGAKKYQDEQDFIDNGVTLVYQGFDIVEYPQCKVNEFIPGLSVIDVLFNVGADATRRLINQ